MSNDHNILVHAHYELLMSEFDYKMWFYDYCYMTHINSQGPIFLYTQQGIELKNDYSQEALEEAITLFENRKI